MGYVVVVSLPVILFILIVALSFYLLGRQRGRSEAARIPQHYGPPVVAPPTQVQQPPPPPPNQEKPPQAEV